MIEVVTAPPATAAVRLPPATRLPKVLQGLGFAVSRRGMIQRLARRHGDVFTLNLPMYGRVVVVGDPQLAKQIFTTSPDELGNIQPNLSRLFGSGSVFALDGEDHRRRRRLLAPPFHGKSMKKYEAIIEEETLRETAGWPEAPNSTSSVGSSRRGSRWAHGWRQCPSRNAVTGATPPGDGWTSGAASTTPSSTG
jgi:cytochrome P450